MFQINKGVDRPPEVLGIRGMNYLIILGVGTVGGMLLATIIMVAGVPAGYAYGGMFALIFLGYNVLVSYSKKYGERGLAKFQARTRYPQVIRVHSSQQYREMLDPAKNGLKTSNWDRLKLKRSN